MTIIYSLNSLVNDTWNTLYEMKHKFYLYQNSNLIFIKKFITSLSKIKFYLYKKNQMIFLIKYQILSLSKTKFYLYQKSKFIFIKNQILSLSKSYLIFAINYLDIFLTN